MNSTGKNQKVNGVNKEKSIHKVELTNLEVSSSASDENIQNEEFLSAKSEFKMLEPIKTVTSRDHHSFISAVSTLTKLHRNSSFTSTRKEVRRESNIVVDDVE